MLKGQLPGRGVEVLEGDVLPPLGSVEAIGFYGLLSLQEGEGRKVKGPT